MSCKFTDLQCKEVICIGSGQRPGFISDVLVELPEGKVCAVVVPCPCRLLSPAGNKDEFIIPWGAIARIGPDIVLVDTKPEDCRVRRQKPKRPALF